MGKIKTFFICAGLCLIFTGSGFCQVLVLKSGQRIQGKIVEQSDKYVKMEFQGVGMVFYSDEIDSIEEEGPAPSLGKNTVTPQMESLYKVYLQSLNVPLSGQKSPPKEEPAAESPDEPVQAEESLAVETKPRATVVPAGVPASTQVSGSREKLQKKPEKQLLPKIKVPPKATPKYAK